MASIAFIHGFNAVAELKHAVRRFQAIRARSHPRLQRRGRIEATSHLAVACTGGRLPRLHRRGHIEAITFPAALNPGTNHPRLQRRGRIEAISMTGCLLRRNSLIHGFNAVAELKLPGLRARVSARALFIHGINAVAELKPPPGAVASKPTRAHPRLQRRGRIEACSSCGVMPR